jgi:hypothetical protein
MFGHFSLLGAADAVASGLAGNCLQRQSADQLGPCRQIWLPAPKFIYGVFFVWGKRDLYGRLVGARHSHLHVELPTWKMAALPTLVKMGKNIT